MLPQFLDSLPLGQSLKNFMLYKISTSIILDVNFQIQSFIKRTPGRYDDNMGNQTPTFFFLKIESRALAINSKPLLMTNLEMNWNLNGCMKIFVWDFENSYRVPKVPKLSYLIGYRCLNLKLTHEDIMHNMISHLLICLKADKSSTQLAPRDRGS